MIEDLFSNSQTNKSSSLKIFKYSKPKNYTQNIKSEKWQIFNLYNFIGRLKLVYFDICKICK
ncbi:hypothetical protein KL86DYS1_10317 [uncultured Dysgonomonas sp.]|uniref:Uncharacterized protein n=1 Tax=uncultured Dysgonomonas sp. TaxID=206096 RepID=A0A212IVY3_9BACT|nr:hypothetical protein KL86DYS1_10317 [uncultured Dysgonomonas sp.]